ALHGAVRNRSGYFGDVADLVRQVVGHRVDVVGQVFPGAGHALDLRLTTQLAFGTHLAGDAAHFRGKSVQLVHHRVDGFLELKDLTVHIHHDLAGEVARGHGRGHFGDVADRMGE